MPKFIPFFVIEHLEPELFDWCKIEYAHVSKWVGKDNILISNCVEVLPFCKTDRRHVWDLKLNNACVLDPDAKQQLTPEIAKRFEAFVFGGILGDDPPRKRTEPELTSKLGLPSFNLGNSQMSTDTAVIVTKLIVDGIPLERLDFQDGLDIEIGENESVRLPYKYLLQNGKAVISPRLIEKLKSQEEF